jgi:Uma2 family endonuclease
MSLTIPDTAELVVRASHVPGPPQGRWDYTAYAALPAAGGYRYEVLNGVLYMAPAPAPEHENIAALVAARLVVVVEDAELGRVFTSPDIDLGASVVRPDAVVVLESNQAIITERKLIGPPNLVVEIASPSTAAYDRDAISGKQAAYAQIGVPEYWIADPTTRSIEVLTLEGDHYRSLGSFSGDDQLPSQVLPGLTVPVRRFFPR